MKRLAATGPGGRSPTINTAGESAGDELDEGFRRAERKDGEADTLLAEAERLVRELNAEPS